MSARVLVVDDEPPIIRAVAANLRARGYQAQTAGNGAPAQVPMRSRPAMPPGKGRVTAPSEADATVAAYFANTPPS